MPRTSSPSFTVELPLVVSVEEDRRLGARFECGKRLTNVMLQHGLGILDRMRADPAWSATRKLSGKVKQAAFTELRKTYGFTETAFHSVAVAHKNAAGFSGRIGTHETQAIATRVFEALEQHLYGKRGRPRFKGRNRPLHSLQGKDNKGMLQWDAEALEFQIERGWRLQVKLPNLARNEWLWTALQARTKYCRLVWRQLRGKRRWYVQLVQEGQTPMKASLLQKLAAPDSTGGIDIGPSQIAWVTENEAGLFRFCAEVDRPHQEIRRLQRRIDRQRRAGNPDNFDVAGRALRGRQWKASKRQQKAEVALREMQRKEAAVRKNAHGRDTNFLLSKARNWRDDGVSPKALQKFYGKSIAVRAPGHYMEALDRKAERAGGRRTKIEVRQLKNSQYDHATDSFRKKRLSERWHVFGDGRGRVQRDLYSAFLARNSEGKSYQPSRVEQAWQALESVLCEAGWYEPQTAKDGHASLRSDFALRQSGSLAKPESWQQHGDAVLPV